MSNGTQELLTPAHFYGDNLGALRLEHLCPPVPPSHFATVEQGQEFVNVRDDKGEKRRARRQRFLLGE